MLFSGYLIQGLSNRLIQHKYGFDTHHKIIPSVGLQNQAYFRQTIPILELSDRWQHIHENPLFAPKKPRKAPQIDYKVYTMDILIKSQFN